MNTPLTPQQIWGMPVFLGIVSAIGLLAALFGDGIWDGLSWLALATPVVVIFWHLARPTSRTSRSTEGE